MEATGETAFDLSGGFISGETIVSDDVSVVLSRGFGGPASVRLIEVNVEKASSDFIAFVPLKSIHQ